MSQMSLELVPLTLTIKVKLAFKPSTVLEKNEPFFNTPSNLKCELIIYRFSAGGGGRLEAGEGANVFCECKKTPLLVNLCQPKIGKLFVIVLK